MTESNVVYIKDYLERNKTRQLARKSADLYVNYDPITASFLGSDDRDIDRDLYRVQVNRELKKKGIN